MKRFALFYNELSGRSFKKNKIRSIRQLLLNYGSVQEFSIKDPKEIDNLAVDFREDFDLIVVAGGDGTANGLINKLTYAGKPFLFLPLGSGNDISASCKHNARLSRIEKALKKWTFKDVDLIEIQSDKRVLCFTVACIGTDAMVSKSASIMPRWVAGQRYVLATLQEIYRSKYIAVKIKFNDFEYAGPISVSSLANTNRYGGGIALSPKSNIEDRQLEFVFVEKLSRIKLIKLFVLLLVKLHVFSKKIKYVKTNEIYLEPIDNAVEIWGDGQYLSSLPAKLSLADAKLRVLSV